MKGILFTTDAIFSLIIVAFAITLLTYFEFTPVSPTLVSGAKSQSILSTFLSTNLATLVNQNTFNKELFYSSQDSNWAQYGSNPSRTYSQTIGPNYPFLLYFFYAPNGITTPMVSGLGNIYFGSGEQLYAINSTTGKVLWSDIPFQSTNALLYPTGLGIYSGELYYTNGTELHAISLSNGNYYWNYTLPNGYLFTSQPLIYNGKVYLGATSSTSNVLYSINAYTGSLSWNTLTPIAIYDSALLNGTLLLTNFAGNVLVVNTNGTQILQTPQDGANTNISTSNQYAYFGGLSSDSLCFIKISLSEFCTSPSNKINYVLSKNNNNTEFTSSAISDLSNTGQNLWTFSDSTFGKIVGNPIITNQNIYTLWSNGYVLATNISTGNIVWFTQLPTSGVGSQILQNGLLSVASGNYIYTFGPCASNLSTNTAYELVSLYSKGFGSCATYIAYSEYNSPNYGIQINGVYGPSNTLYDYTGDSYTQFNYPLAEGSNIYMGSGGTGIAIGNNLQDNNWYNVVLVNNASLGTYTSYINGVKSQTGFSSSTQSYSISEWVYPYNTINPFYYLDGVSIGSANKFFVGCSSLPCSNGFNGIITNIQLYATTLSQNNLSQIYSSGIGSYPVAQNLVAWLPLEGDSNDYSGLGNTGYNYNVNNISMNYIPTVASQSTSISEESTLLTYGSQEPLAGNIIQNSNKGRLYKLGVYTWN
ncbi:MAG: PQQ-binding-like beta-propeller repeat protein [Candidatus Micrarchaeia archaeon]